VALRIISVASKAITSYQWTMKSNKKRTAMNSRKNAEQKRAEMLLDIIQFTAFRSWGAVAFLFKPGFRGTYEAYCRRLGWFDRQGNTMRSMVSRSFRIAKERGFIPKDAKLSEPA